MAPSLIDLNFRYLAVRPRQPRGAKLNPSGGDEGGGLGGGGLHKGDCKEK